MVIKGVSRGDLDAALEHVNAQYGGNVAFKRIERIGRTRDGAEKWRVTLKTLSSRGPGSRVSASGRRTPAACWHVHGEFFDALPDGVVVESTLGTYRPGGYWQDRNIGSRMHAFMFSEACDCWKEEV